MRFFASLIIFIFVFNCNLFGQIGDPQDEPYRSILAADSVLKIFYDSLMIFMSEEMKAVFKEKGIPIDTASFYDYDSFELNVLMVSGKLLFLVKNGEDPNICYNLLNNRRKKRIRHVLFLATIAEQKKLPLVEIESFILSFNVVKNGVCLFHADYTIILKNENLQISKKEISF